MSFVEPEQVFEEAEHRGWPMSTLGEVCRTTSGGTPSRKRPDYFQGSIPWVKSGELTDGLVSDIEEFITEEALASSSAKRFPPGTLLIAMYGATVGKLGLLGREASTNQAVCAIFPPPELDTKFLFWFLRHQRSNLVAQAVGGAQPNISQTILRALRLPLPPLRRQREIVAEIEKQFSRLDEAVADLQRVKANLKRYKASVLKAAAEGRLVETEAAIARREDREYETGEHLLQRILKVRRDQWKRTTRYVEPASATGADQAMLPEGWGWSTVQQLNPAQRACAYGVLQPGESLEGGVPFVRVGDIDDGQIDFIHMKRIHADIAAAYPRTKLVGGEVLLTLVGAIGRTAVVPPSLAGGNVARAVGVLPIAAGVDANWVEIWFRNPAKIAEMTGKSHEVARKTLNLEDVRGAHVALPPLVEQRRIAAEVDRRLSLVREVQSEMNSNLQRAHALRQGVLSQQFGART